MKVVEGFARTEKQMKCVTDWCYSFQCESGKVIYLKTYNDIRINIFHNVKVTYQVEKSKDPKYRNENIIKSVENTRVIGLIDEISRILGNYNIRKSIINTLVDDYKGRALEYVLYEKSRISSDNDSNDESKFHKLRLDNAMYFYKSFFKERGIRYEKKWGPKIYDVYDVNVDEILKKPYMLYTECKLPFKHADTIGLSMGLMKNYQRINAIVKYMFKTHDQNGISYLTFKEMQKWIYTEKIQEWDTTKYTNEDSQIVVTKVKKSLVKIKTDQGIYYTTKQVKDKEEYIEVFLENLKSKPVNKPSRSDLVNLANDPNLDPSQKEAVKMILENNIGIITGAPGSGKTYVIRGTCLRLNPGETIVLAPTGAAVQKLKQEISEAFGNDDLDDSEDGVNEPDCRTIHSLLFSKEKPRCKNIIIDEMSMVSMSLFHKLLKYVSKNEISKLLISGDADQLPSIQCGNLMYDLVKHSGLPCKKLSNQHRTKAPNVNANAQLILQGKSIENDKDKTFIIKNINFASEITSTLMTLLNDQTIQPNNSSILIPQKVNGVCTNAYNKILQSHYNPTGKVLLEKNKIEFRMGDKVINKKNNYELKIFNGSILTIIGYSYKISFRDPYDDLMVKQIVDGTWVSTFKPVDGFPSRAGMKFNEIVTCKYHEDETDLVNGVKIELNMEQFEHIELAYATTIHSAQGKGYQTVIIILHSSMHDAFMTRKLLYTAVTRSKEKCIIITDQTSLNKCRRVDKSRITNLYQHNEAFYYRMMLILAMIKEASCVEYIKKHLECCTTNNKFRKVGSELLEISHIQYGNDLNFNQLVDVTNLCFNKSSEQENYENIILNVARYIDGNKKDPRKVGELASLYEAMKMRKWITSFNRPDKDVSDIKFTKFRKEIVVV